MLNRLRDLRTIRSWWGWPVPAVPRVVTAARLGELIETAGAGGFSRRGRKVPVEPELEYLLLPHLPEMSPSPSWICIVVAIPAAGAPVSTPGKIRFGLLDVSLDDFRRLPPMRRRRRDELLNWLAHVAYDRRS